MDKWNDWYKNLDKNNPTSFVYSDTVSYIKGFQFLNDCETIEDWGCGAGGFKRFFLSTPEKYIGIDGSNTPFADKKVDLVNYVSKIDGIFMRHVLEHNYEWRNILRNSLKSFQKKMCLVLFTPFKETETELAHNLKHGVDVPDLSFNKDELISIISNENVNYSIESLNTNTGYGIEHILYLTKNNL